MHRLKIQATHILWLVLCFYSRKTFICEISGEPLRWIRFPPKALTLTDTLDHLPASKRRELARELEIIFFEIKQFRSTKQSAKKANGKILKVILYRSCARGD